MSDKEPLKLSRANRRERAELAGNWKKKYSHIRENVYRKYRSGARGWDLVTEFSEQIDSFIRKIFEERERAHLAGCKPGQSGLSVIALGGYGRKDLAPYSDIDIMVLSSRGASPVAREINADFVQLLWDIGFQVGHRFCSVGQAVVQGKRDLVSQTAMLEARFLTGNPDPCRSFHRKLNRGMAARSRKQRFITDKIREREEIVRRFGPVVNLSEPNLKESPGGLRDYHLVLWSALATLGGGSLETLAQRNILTVEEYRDFKGSLDFIFRMRFGLHFFYNRKQDRLSFEAQPRIAAQLGYEEPSMRIISFMKDYYRWANQISYLSRLAVKRCYSLVERKPLKSASVSGFPALALAGKTLAVADKHALSELFQRRPEKLLELFCLAAREGLDLDMELRSVIRGKLALVNDRFRSGRRSAKIFKEILKQENIYKTLELMHQVRLLDRYIPEFSQLLGLIQNDPYHMFTVDEHILILFKHLHELTGADERELADLRKLARKYANCHILKLGVLLHDIGKGGGSGDHHEIGLKKAEAALKRWGVSPLELSGALFLVKNHLQMSELAQHQDIDDPAIVIRFAERVGSLENLERLYLLTYADIRAVRENVWTVWKGALLAELFQRTRFYLDREPSGETVEAEKKEALEGLKKEFPPDWIDRFGKMMPSRYFHFISREKIAEHVKLVSRLDAEKSPVSFCQNERRGCTELLMCSHDRKGNINRVSGTLAALNINILGAELYTSSSGIAVNTIQFTDRLGKPVLDREVLETIAENLRKVMTGETSLESLWKKRPDYIRRTEGKGVEIITEVGFDNDMSPAHTVMKVSARDEIGFLYRITSVLSEYDIFLAKIHTEGSRAVDTFYLTRNRRKITDRKKQSLLADRIKVTLSKSEL
ncbi:MAG: [protein-PII] uridylyltransferase [bacterium]